jgi:hypothetical protein
LPPCNPLALIFLTGVLALAQSEHEPDGRPRTINQGTVNQGDEHFAAPALTPAPTPFPPIIITRTQRPNYPTPTPAQTPVYRPTSVPTPIYIPRVSPTPPPNSMTAADLLSERVLPEPIYNGKILPMNVLRARINEARSFMQSRPLLTASVTLSLPNVPGNIVPPNSIPAAIPTITTDVVRIAALDTLTSKIHYTLLSKAAFLSRGQQFFATTSEGRNVRIQVLRANGVNTAVSVIDDQNNSLLPMIVQYPVERNGSFYETAYYSSAHPGTISAEIAYVGKMYLRNTIDAARANLQKKGVFVTPQVADIAERLCAVEHVDHLRFNTEYNLALFNEIFTLFALNEGNTYRYAVSTAGAGGLVQMIPSTYSMVRNRHFNAGLMPNFVDGMRNHVNAAEAMLLYMQDTWNDLSSNSDVLDAMSRGYATQAELMSAGYNSNPAKLPGYIRRGGAGWKFLIPKETQIYHRIYASLDKFVPMTPRVK